MSTWSVTLTESQQVTSWNGMLVIFVRLLNKSSTFFVSRSFLTAFTRARHWPVCSANCSQFANLHLSSFYIDFNNILTSTADMKWYLPSPTKTAVAFPLRPIHATCLVHSILLLLSHACYTPCSSNPRRILLSHRTLKSIQNMKLVIFSSAPSSHTLAKCILPVLWVTKYQTRASKWQKYTHTF
jgi:hypothetical protein